VLQPLRQAGLQVTVAMTGGKPAPLSPMVDVRAPGGREGPPADTYEVGSP
jgi:hypothetical protein